MEIETTREEDKKAWTILDEALEKAYDDGRYDTAERGNVCELWEKLMEVIGVVV